MTVKATEDDLEFLVDLNRRCCKIETWSGYAYTKSGKLKVDSYDIEVRLTEDEIERIFKIVKKNQDLLAYPTCSMFGFDTTIKVYDLEKKKELLSFAHTQLPEGYDQKRLIPYLQKPANKCKAERIGLNMDKLIEDHVPWSY
ncbi:hypothetical protein J4417_02565 [Candidatus Woesearchaeota archaeon]|nr:hypothetical protein [Candidatus Woesearchaeota archaeon]